MTDFKNGAQLAGVPEKMIWKMHRMGLVANPLRDQELAALRMISYIWRSAWFLRMALSGFSHARRMELFLKPELNRVERYILKCYLNAPEGKRAMEAQGLGQNVLPQRARGEAYPNQEHHRPGRPLPFGQDHPAAGQAHPLHGLRDPPRPAARSDRLVGVGGGRRRRSPEIAKNFVWKNGD